MSSQAEIGFNQLAGFILGNARSDEGHVDIPNSKTSKYLETDGPDIDGISIVFSLPGHVVCKIFEESFWRRQLSWRQISSNSLGRPAHQSSFKCCCKTIVTFFLHRSVFRKFMSFSMPWLTYFALLPFPKTWALLGSQLTFIKSGKWIWLLTVVKIQCIWCFLAPGCSCNPLTRMEAFGMFIIGVLDESAGHLGLKSGWDVRKEASLTCFSTQDSWPIRMKVALLMTLSSGFTFKVSWQFETIWWF